MKIYRENDKIYLEPRDQIVGAIIVNPPEIFSIINNTENTINFFNEVLTIFEAENFDGRLIFDLRKVTSITADAIMYMNAIAVKRISLKKDQKVSVIFPENKKCSNFLKKCGLKKYLLGLRNSKLETNKYYTITGGHTTDVKRIKEIGLFVCEKMNIEISDLDFITSTIVELMNNTQQHAYDEHIDKLWYIFIEDTKTSLKFTFLDTGKGIPETMIKSFETNIDDLVPIIEDDHSYFIFEALKGNVPRSSSNDTNRNTGLPEIYKHYKNNKLSKLNIISCKGVCKFYDSNKNVPKKMNLENSFCGTLFTWEVKKTLKR